ncbi:xanthine dehydrogenase family protein molybdopterin-binding subunit [Wohlfahrtiimonas chitiniclastica]|uniref:Xanthine dehydrogenase family protein molybdopterin-binding subunit n=1 Tax=Wohlfahrtiimonas chitiniclastica TaxID=400946 RepID=A0AB35BYJ7_9GAMM|nr:molybdopterin cofactor-binding domain-containing protein [Wohlfahrtiimonas chitiniclastica]MBS7825043.1 xanthine dehydrogenase family protein molybdopterin-binding subunit [Wohlfahrtiimonas chitiniclastica]MBS7840648.1 xanthine dehydrogenase family protein molybdopterin-binding subunit [Wohlfahrtiimonas chitiniclastica]
MKESGFSRRSFLKCLMVAGVSVYIAKPFSKAHAALFEENILQSPNWDPKTRRIKNRLDAFAKVTGQKVFAFDIRARDMPHWPQQQAHAFLLRATSADHIYKGIDLTILEQQGLMPDTLLTAEDLEQDGVKLPEFFGDDMLLPKGKTPAYIGQAVAMLIYNDFDRFRFAKNAVQFRTDVIIYGEKTGFLERNPWSTYRGVRIGAKNPYDRDIYSAMEYTTISPLGFRKYIPFWPEGKKGGNLEQTGIYYAEQLAKEMKHPPEDWLILDREFYSQSIDVCAMEPCNSNGWYDEKNEALHFVVADQSAMDVSKHIIELVNQSHFKFKKLFLHPCSTVGYGSKGGAIEPMFGVVASLYGKGLPVRFANDRYEQFQSGIKRHAFDMHFQLAVNKKTHKIESFIGNFIANGGGRCNYTPGVVAVGSTGVQGIYYIPKSDINAVGIASRAVDAGSIRGFGTLQSMTAFDTLLDEAAHILHIDPVEFRMNNLMKSGMKNTQGAIPAGDMRGGEALSTCAEHPIWKNRTSRKQAYEAANPGKLLATGISCTQKDFGTGNESSFAKIEISPEGEISLWHSGLEIGSGMETSQTVLCAQWFGVPAHHSYFAITEWPDLPMTTEGSHHLTQEKQNELQNNPMWTPAFSSSTGASNSAYFFSHVTSETGRVLFDYGIWPAALSIWYEGIGGGQATPLTVRREDARWNEKGLTADGLEPLSLQRIAKRIYEMNGLTGVVAHGYNRWQWAEAEFKIHKNKHAFALDGLSLKWGQNNHYEVNKRLNVKYPAIQRNNAAVTNYTAIAIAVELSIDTANGNIHMLNHHSVLECGNMIVPQLVSGQIQGGIAMGIGHALYEYLPLYEDGPGNGTWNFNRYHLPLASEVAVWTQTSEVLPPLSETDPPKGMAEVVMIPVVSAITNAIAAATGHYFNHHPILPKQVLEVLNANHL